MNAKRWCSAQVMAALGWMPALCVLLYESSTGLNRGMTTPLWLHNELLQQQHVQDATTVHAKKRAAATAMRRTCMRCALWQRVYCSSLAMMFLMVSAGSRPSVRSAGLLLSVPMNIIVGRP